MQASAVYRDLSANATGKTARRTSCVLTGWYLFNNASSVRYLKLYDQATIPDSEDPPVLTLPIPADGNGANVSIPDGLRFANGLSIRATTGPTDSDSGNPAENEVIVNLFLLR